ncbi:flavoprotein [Nocardia sp. NPDC050175]|uniref:flavoprotein n=1 Tax=Nocardia sp. NPDC050175 TaxID=3364317 RepID=UPI00379E7DA6
MVKFLLYVTGAAAAALTPLNLLTFDALRPDDELRVVLSRTAETFVTTRTCAAGNRTVSRDCWETDEAVHLPFAAWPDVVIVYPATLDFLGRLRSGVTNTPMMLALQCTAAAVYLCPALPPGAENSPAFRAVQEFAAQHSQYRLVDTAPGYSLAMNADAGRAPAAFAEVLELCGAQPTRAEAVRWTATAST